MFNSCTQGNENFDSYDSKLRQLAASCDYGALEHEMIRDRVVIGIYDNAQRVRLLREKDLTLSKAIELCRSIEITSIHVQEITVAEVHYVKNKQKKEKTMRKDCTFCGETHERRKCPVFGHVCTICNKRNHVE